MKSRSEGEGAIIVGLGPCRPLNSRPEGRVLERRNKPTATVMAILTPWPKPCARNGRQKPPVETGKRTCGAHSNCPLNVPAESRASNWRAPRPGPSAYQSGRPLTCESHGASCRSRPATTRMRAGARSPTHCRDAARSRPPWHAFGPPFAGSPGAFQTEDSGRLPAGRASRDERVKPQQEPRRLLGVLGGRLGPSPLLQRKSALAGDDQHADSAGPAGSPEGRPTTSDRACCRQSQPSRVRAADPRRDARRFPRTFPGRRPQAVDSTVKRPSGRNLRSGEWQERPEKSDCWPFSGGDQLGL